MGARSSWRARQRTVFRGLWPVALLIGYHVSGQAVAVAQVPDSTKKPSLQDSALVDTLQQQARSQVLASAHTVHWYEVVAVLGGVSALTLVDEPLQRFIQRNHSNTLDHISSVFRHGGEPEYYAGVSLGVLAVGVVAGNADIQRAGGRLVASVLFSGLTSEGVKRLAGRSRPNERLGAYRFHPFTSLRDSAGIEARGALPSGHTTAAFAMATSLADDIDNPWADVLLYTFAAGTAWSRINDNRHWLSDTVLGAALGITTAKVVSGRWRIFHLRPPGFLVTPTGAPTLSWRIPF